MSADTHATSSSAPAYGGMPRLGRYVLVREIARSNDVVWEATDPQMNRRVAVKELALPATLNGAARRDRIERFYREARAAGAMSHPGIVTIYEVGEDDGRYFIAMEYLEGQTLRGRLAAGGGLPLVEAIRITSALCDALSYAHARGVIHRDIKPDNVHLLPGGEVKLTDFGIARITHEESLTMDGQIFGTPSYMSPEQIVGKNIDTRSDVFSVGILLYEMLSGRKPFTGDSVVTITYRILHDELPALAGVPAGVDAVVRRATAKEPGARFASTADLKTALTQAATGPDTSAAWAYASQAAAASRAGGAAAGAPAQATVAYSARTQLGNPPALATPAGGAPSSVANDFAGGGHETATEAARGPLAVLLAVLFFGVLLLGGGYLLSRAYQNFSLQAQGGREQDRLNAAMGQFKAGEFDRAAAGFRALRESPISDVRARAPLYESYCWRSLANPVILAQNWAKAEQLLRSALNASQVAVSRAPGSQAATKEYQEVLNQLNEVLRASGAPAGSLVPGPASAGSGGPNPGSANGPTLDGATPLPGAAGTPPAGAPTTAAFQNANAANAANADRLLREGDDAWNRRGDPDEAVNRWNQAVQAGPGSNAAVTAQDRLNRYNNNQPPVP